MKLSRCLGSAAQKLGVRKQSLFQLACAVVLARLTGCDEVTFISQHITGEILPLRLQIGPEAVDEMLSRMHGQSCDNLSHKHAALELYAPPCDVLMHWGDVLNSGFCVVEELTIGMGRANHNRVCIQVEEFEHEFRLTATAPNSYEAEQLCDYMRTALERLVGVVEMAPTTSVGSIDVMPDSERRQVLMEWNATHQDFLSDRCIHELFEVQAAKTPNAVAVAFEDRNLSYSDLNARANRLSHHLRELGVRPDSLVAMCMERGFDMVVGLLAILKAGGGYVPLDPSYPVERLAYMLEDSAPVALLTHAAAKTALASHVVHLPIVDLEADGSHWADRPDVNPDPRVIGLRPTNLAYVIYTSGSTGLPKGAMNEHRGLVNRLSWMQTAYGLRERDAVLQKTPFSFDVSVWEFFWPLMTGARLVMAQPDGHKDSDYLAEVIQRERITVLHFVPSMLMAFLEHEAAKKCRGVVVRVMCSGEALPASLVRRFHKLLPGVELHNLYGPTEAAVDVTSWACVAGDEQVSIPIGRPIANTRIYILDGQGRPAPIGASGEIFIGGVQVGRGYLNRPELTAERFLIDPFSSEPAARLYKTSDLGRWRPDGAIEYLGRNDFQVKIRGSRIELGEIEARLAEHSAVRQAVVMVREDVPGDKRLVAYIVGVAAAETVALLRGHLCHSLPNYMIPVSFVFLDRLPVTPNGKLDRRGLPAPGEFACARRRYEPPVGAIEERLAQIYAEVLTADRVGRHDDFFELGGDSLIAARLFARIQKEFGRRYTLGSLFKYPTVKDLAWQLHHVKGDEDEHTKVVILQAEGSRSPIFAINAPDMYYGLSKHLGRDQPFVGLQLIDPHEKTECDSANFGYVAAQYVELIRDVQPRGPYAIIGWCVGGALAVEVGRQFIEAGEKMSFLGVIDGWAPGRRKRIGRARLRLHDHSLWWEAIAKRVRELSAHPSNLVRFVCLRILSVLQRAFSPKRGLGAGSSVWADPPDVANLQLEHRLARLAENFEIKSFKCSITLFWASLEPRGWFVDETQCWRDVVGEELDAITIAGDHTSIFKDPGAGQMAAHISVSLTRKSAFLE